MKDFIREYPAFSLCGLNCKLCTMHLGGYCPGCGGGAGNQSCAIARCGVAHGVEFCWDCGEYPCGRYEGFCEYDSFIPCRVRRRDINRARSLGLDAYLAELDEKVEILHFLLQHYNDGRRKSFFSSAIYLLELTDIRDVLLRLPDTEALTLKERATRTVDLFQDMAAVRGVSLKLNKKPKKK